jgi:hypothetical protein
VRHRRAAKQRLWLGPGRYFCGCEWRIAHADAYGDGDCNSNRCCDSDTNSNRRRNRDANCNGHRDSDGNGDRDSYSECKSDTYGQACSHSEASSHASAKAVVGKPRLNKLER